MARPKKGSTVDGWQGRKNKTRQDRIPAGQRDRVHEWDRRRSWMMEHKPRRRADWLAFRG